MPQAPRLYDLTDPECPAALGDTHLLITQAARLAGVTRKAISYHLQTGRFTRALGWVTPSHSADVPQAGHYVLVEYDHELAEYINKGGLQGISDKKIREIDRLVKRMPMRAAAREADVSLSQVKYLARSEIIQTLDWEEAQQIGHRDYHRRRKRKAYQRQMHALELRAEGHTVKEIAEMMDLSRHTIHAYMRGKYRPSNLSEAENERLDTLVETARERAKEWWAKEGQRFDEPPSARK